MRNAHHILSIAVLLSLTPLARAADEPVAKSRDTELTLGAIQRSIRAGMSTGEVVDAVGSPNLVTRGKNGRESWVYDRFSTEMSEQGVQVGGGGLGSAAGASSGILGVLGVSAGKRKSTTSQRSLMLVVTFGADGMVDSFTYRSSKF